MTFSLKRPVYLNVPPMGSGSPSGHSGEANRQRDMIHTYLRDVVMIPPDLVDRRVQELTLSERVYLEIDMQREAKQMHSYDYEPLRWGGIAMGHLFGAQPSAVPPPPPPLPPAANPPTIASAAMQIPKPKSPEGAAGFGGTDETESGALNKVATLDMPLTGKKLLGS